jgi:LPXTG-motif cell wall-anchored protein
VAQGTLGQPCKHPLTITIETEDTADLLTATLEVPAAPPHRQRPISDPGWPGLGGTLLLSGAGLLALRRRPRVTTPGSPV